MALEITRVDEHRIEGLLDGSLPFLVKRKGNVISARIAEWRKDLTNRGPGSIRGAAYELLARYRESQRFMTP